MVQKLSDREISAFLKEFPQWKYLTTRQAIKKKFEFADFNEAFGFLTRVAIMADMIGHHPEIFNIYKTIVLTMTTHDVGGLSEKDVRMATFIEKVAKSVNAKGTLPSD